MEQIRFGNNASAHLYELGVRTPDGKLGLILVDANTRQQARKLAEHSGYIVNDVNMIG